MANILKFPICIIKGHVLDTPSIINFTDNRNHLKKCSRCGLYHAYSDVSITSVLMTERGAMKMKREFEEKFPYLKTKGEMIHCKECEWYEPDSGICKESEHDELFGENDGCNQGKRKDD